MPFHHIILLKYKPGVSQADVDKVRASLHGLATHIPSISEIKAGRKRKHFLDHDFDEGVILVFKDEAALEEYASHQAHLDYQAFTAPYVQDKLIYDICVEE